MLPWFQKSNHTPQEEKLPGFCENGMWDISWLLSRKPEVDDSYSPVLKVTDALHSFAIFPF